jgi:hypothetical protein
MSEVCGPAALMRSAVQNNKQAVNLSVHQDGGRPRIWIPEMLETGNLKSQCHAITNKSPEAASALQQVHKMLSDTETFAKCTPARVGESSEWTTVVNNAEESRAKFGKCLDGKPLFSSL